MHLGAGSWGRVGIESPPLPAGQVLSTAQMRQCWGELMEDALAGCLSPALAGHLSPLAVSPVAVSRSASTDLVLHVCCHSAALGFLDFNAAGDAGSSGWTEVDMLALSWVFSAG